VHRQGSQQKCTAYAGKGLFHQGSLGTPRYE
jgi:hypothetical protein